jgi:thioester reductase-like protein
MSANLDLTKEAFLPEDIQFPQPLLANLAEPAAIFLTGATGFLGAYLLDELLRKTTAKIYCLMRCEGDAEAGKQRLKQHLQSYSVWQEAFSERIIPVLGDLAQPLFGLSNQQFNALAEQIEVIYHNGAWVNAIYPYAALKNTNVGGTLETLRLAGFIRTKPVHFISTVAVFFSDFYNTLERTILETDNAHPDLKGGYKQSKWVAENLIFHAQQRGLPANIYRTARIMGHSKTGISRNFNDFLISLIKVCIQLKKFPDLDSSLYLVPVDFAAQSVICLSQQPQSIGKTFHIFNPHPIAWNDFFQEIKALGYALEKVSWTQWRAEVQQAASENKKDKVFASLRGILTSTSPMLNIKPAFDMSQTLAGLANTSIQCPAVESELVSKWICYFQTCGFLPKP